MVRSQFDKEEDHGKLVMIFISGRILFKKVVLSSRYYHSQFHRHKGGEFHKIILCRTLQGKDLDGDSEYEQNRDQI